MYHFVKIFNFALQLTQTSICRISGTEQKNSQPCLRERQFWQLANETRSPKKVQGPLKSLGTTEKHIGSSLLLKDDYCNNQKDKTIAEFGVTVKQTGEIFVHVVVTIP